MSEVANVRMFKELTELAKGVGLTIEFWREDFRLTDQDDTLLLKSPSLTFISIYIQGYTAGLIQHSVNP